MRWRGAFSTLGCPGLPLERVARLAREGGWSGVELRAAPGEPVHAGLTREERAAARATLERAGVAPLAVASYVEVDDPAASDEEVVSAALAHVELARDLGAPFLRVFPGGPSPDGAAERRLRSIAGRLDAAGSVAVAVETHDSCSRGADLAALLGRVGHPRVRAIWDVQHPWRAGERVGATLRALGPFLAYVQITEARSRADATPCIPGDGAVPLREVRGELLAAGYAGWVSFEWAAYWYPDAPPLAEALPAARRWLDGTLWTAGDAPTAAR